MRLKNTLEYLGLWEKLNNPNFKGVEFDPLLTEAGSNLEWSDAHPDLKGNVRDYATINELICLSNMENLNALFINDGLAQNERRDTLD